MIIGILISLHQRICYKNKNFLTGDREGMRNSMIEQFEKITFTELKNTQALNVASRLAPEGMIQQRENYVWF
jgi:hypothetical protein